MKITSLFTRISHGSSKTNSENNDLGTNTKLYTSPISSPDIVPPSPVLEKKKAIKAKRSLNKVLVDVDDKNKSKDKYTNLKTISTSLLTQTSDCTLNLNKEDDQYDCIDSQSINGTESLTSTIICDETDYCSDLYFDDWNDCSISAFK